MAATTTPGVSFTEFRTLIESAITRRSNFSYTHRKAIHFHWANDNTHPDLDLLSLEKMCELIGFAKPDSHVLEESNPLPGYTMRSKIDDEVKAAIHRPGRTILIVHYAGHGTDNGSGELVLSDRWGKKLARADLLLASVESTELASDAPIDVLYIFDCCFSFLATRQINARSRLVEVLAANDYRNPSAFGPQSAHSLTSKLYLEVRDRAQRGEKMIEIAQIMDKLQQSTVVKTPSHAVKIGLGSIVLPLSPFPNPRSATSTSSQPAYRPGLLASFTIHTTEPCDEVDIRNAANWAESFPQSKTLSLHYEGSKRVNSTLFFFEVQRLAFLRIAGAPGVTLICENKPYTWNNPSQRAHFTGSVENSGVNDENKSPCNTHNTCNIQKYF